MKIYSQKNNNFVFYKDAEGAEIYCPHKESKLSFIKVAGIITLLGLCLIAMFY